MRVIIIILCIFLVSETRSQRQKRKKEYPFLATKLFKKIKKDTDLFFSNGIEEVKSNVISINGNIAGIAMRCDLGDCNACDLFTYFTWGTILGRMAMAVEQYQDQSSYNMYKKKQRYIDQITLIPAKAMIIRGEIVKIRKAYKCNA